MKHTKHQTLNGAASEIAKAFNGTTGIRRTYGGGDDSNRMHISWQLLRGERPIGMIDLYCEDGYGNDGMQWASKVCISAPGIDFSQYLFSPWDGLSGRTAKRMARNKFFTNIENLIKNALSKNVTTIYHSPITFPISAGSRTA